MKLTELAGTVEQLAERVARLEGAERPRQDAGTELGERLGRALAVGADGDAVEAATVVYGGAGPWQGRTVAWQMVRDWEDVLSASGDAVATVLSALANGTRIRIVAELLRGPVATGELAERLEQPSSGQLFHHLKGLLAAGVIHQPVRGTYAIRTQHAVPILAVLSAATDLAGPTQDQEEPW